MAYVVKAAPTSAEGADALSFDEKTMYRGKHVGVGDEIFVFSSETQGGHGLCARGVVTSVARGPGIRVSITVKPVAPARQALGRRELKPYRELADSQPQTELARKLCRQATNKIAGISDQVAAFLGTFF